MSQIDQPNRRDLLKFATGGMGAVALGAAGLGMLSTCAPNQASDPQAWLPRVDLDGLEPGILRVAMVLDAPLFLIRLTEAQIQSVRDVAMSDLHDPLSRNANLLPDRLATLENRTIDLDGPVLILDGLCPRLGCVPLSGAGDFGGFFCPCGGTHFDSLGRMRKGAAPTNMRIPRFDVSGQKTLRVFEGREPVSGEMIDHLLYGSGD